MTNGLHWMITPVKKPKQNTYQNKRFYHTDHTLIAEISFPARYAPRITQTIECIAPSACRDAFL